MSEMQPTKEDLLAAYLRTPDTEEGHRALTELLARGFTLHDLIAVIDRIDALFADAGYPPADE